MACDVSPVAMFKIPLSEEEKTGASKLLEGRGSQNFGVIPKIKLFLCLP